MKLATAIVIAALTLTACTEGGGIYGKSDENFSVGRSIGGIAAVLLGAGAVSCAKDPNCTLPTQSSYAPTYTGGPDFDWDMFNNGQHRCRTVTNGYNRVAGQWAVNENCAGMPLDDDRWPG